MIYNYEIKKIAGEEILYLYFDLNSEFGKFNFKQNINKLEDIIKNFIEENKIAFKGVSVAIVVGGVLTYSVTFKNPVNNYQKDLTNNPVIAEKINISETNLEEKVNQENIENVITENDQEQKDLENNINKSQTNAIKQSDSTNKTSVNSQNEETKASTKDEAKTETTKEQDEMSEKQTEEEKENKIYVTVKRTSGSVVKLELEEYIIGVVGAEMPASFNSQALMAQAILARTYALKAIDKGITLTDNSSTQNYKNNSELKSVWQGSFNKYYNKVKEAVYNTEGLYLSYKGQKIEAVYHSTSNGYTENASNVWGNYFPYLVTVESPYDTTNKSFEAEKFISYTDLSNKLNMEINSTTDFNILGKTSGNRVDTISINGTVYSGVKLRNLLGLRSTDFDIIKNDEGITFKTKGFGHGVGMSQYGANGMANNGYKYNQILSHYYKGTTINHI